MQHIEDAKEAEDVAALEDAVVVAIMKGLEVVNQHAPKKDGANLITPPPPQKIWNCIYCEIYSHHTVDCRELISARKLATEHFTKKTLATPPLHVT
jgi:hypothetical protein